MLERAAEILDVNLSELDEFIVEDTFNKENTLHGVLCRRGDHRYGALVIFKVNDYEREQVIWGTPKQKYPFDRQGTFKWPAVDHAIAYEKIDGTNIVSYEYFYTPEKSCHTYKTRLTPVVKDGRFGSFCQMWFECLERYPWIEKCVQDNFGKNLSFELYGSRNEITVKYDVDLAVKLLFGIQRYYISPPNALDLSSLPDLPKEYLIENKQDLTEAYQSLRALASTQNEADSLRTEGMVLYTTDMETFYRVYHQWKVKPAEIEAIHWAAGGIPKNSLWATAMNTYESTSEPSYDDYCMLLKEEYTDQQIEQVIGRVKSVWNDVHHHILFQSRVNDVWAKAREAGLDVKKDKGATLKFVSQFFNKKDMRRVGSVILKQAGLL